MAKKQERQVACSLRFPESLWQQAKEKAAASDLSVQQLMTRALMAYLGWKPLEIDAEGYKKFLADWQEMDPRAAKKFLRDMAKKGGSR